jgi:formate hydrogenlyase subunit 6/NADH:ubiquinone oxidoreductase subunit I
MAKISRWERLRIPTYDNEQQIVLGRVEVDEEKCTGCGMCASICPGKALYLEGAGKNKKARMEPVFPQCMGCNDCAAVCEKGALKVTVPYEFSLFYKTIDRGEFTGPRPF